MYTTPSGKVKLSIKAILTTIPGRNLMQQRSRETLVRIFQASLLIVMGFAAARALMFVLSLPDKYALTLAIGLIVSPLMFLVRDKDKVLIALFLASLPIGVGIRLMEREETTNLLAKLTFRFTFSELLLVILTGIWLFRVLSRQTDPRYSILRTKVALPLMLWIGVGCLSMVPAVDRVAVVIGLIRLFGMFLVFLNVFHFIKGMEQVHFIIKCILALLFFESILIFVQHLTGSLVLHFPGDTMSLDIVESGMRPGGTMGHSSHFAKFSGLMLPIALAYALVSFRIRDKIFFWSVWLSGSCALILTLSRAGIVAWLLSILLMPLGVFALRIKNIHFRAHIIGVIIVLLGLSVGLIHFVGANELRERIAYDSDSAGTRIPMYQVALNVIRAHPLLGVGLNNYTIVDQNYDHTPVQITTIFSAPVHNLFLLFAAEMGLPALIFFGWFLGAIIKSASRYARNCETTVDKIVALGIMIGLFSLILQSMTGKGVVDHPIHLTLIAIFAASLGKLAMILNNRYEPSEKGLREEHS